MVRNGEGDLNDASKEGSGAEASSPPWPPPARGFPRSRVPQHHPPASSRRDRPREGAAAVGEVGLHRSNAEVDGEPLAPRHTLVVTPPPVRPGSRASTHSRHSPPSSAAIAIQGRRPGVQSPPQEAARLGPHRHHHQRRTGLPGIHFRRQRGRVEGGERVWRRARVCPQVASEGAMRGREIPLETPTCRRQIGRAHV